jgi:hypothetical protein
MVTEPDSGTSSLQHCLPSLPQSAVLRVQIPRGSPRASKDACQEPWTQHRAGKNSTEQTNAAQHKTQDVHIQAGDAMLTSWQD